MSGKLPERRSYSSAKVFGEYVYIFGGQDLKEGSYNNLYRLPINHILEGGTGAWEYILTYGTVPPPISHHNG